MVGGTLIMLLIRKHSAGRSALFILGALCILFGISNIGIYGTGFILMAAMMLLRGAGRSAAFYAQGKFTERADGPNKGMFVAAFLAGKALLFTGANNVGGALYKISPTLPFATEIVSMAVWAALFWAFLRVTERKEPLDVPQTPINP